MQGYDLYFDDFKVGSEFVTGGITVTEGQIIDFAMMWDPQPVHMSVDSPKTEAMGGLMASGFHTICLTFRLFLGSGVLAASNMSSPGMDNLRWLKPVRPGDTLHVVSKVIEVTPSRSKPMQGAMTMEHRTINQKDETVFSVECVHFLRRRPGDAKTGG